MFNPSFESILGADLVMEGAANNNVAEEMLGLELMKMANMQQLQQEQAWERQREAERQQQAAERARQEQIEQQKLAEQRKLEEIRKQQQYQQFMQQGNIFMDNNQFTQAIEQYNLALRDYPTDINAKFNIACCVENLNNIQGAYKLFMELVDHGAFVPELPKHISNCETILARCCAAHLQEAQKAYSDNLLADAIAQLNLAKSYESRSQIGEMLLHQVDELVARIQWDHRRETVNAQFIAGKKAIERQEFNIAIESFTNCQREYENHAVFLKNEDQENQHQLTGLLAQAKRGLELQFNQNTQAVINSKLLPLEQAINAFDMKHAIPLLEEIISLCAKITRTEDVIDLGYITLDVLNQSLNTLNQWQHDFEGRKNTNSLNFVQSITANINNEHKLSTQATELLQALIQKLLKRYWPDLDRRNLSNLMELITGIIKTHIQQANCITACYYGASYYIDDMENLSAEIEQTIANNLPQDYRAAIQLNIFQRQAQIVSASAILFSENIRVAEVVNVLQDEEKTKQQSLGLSF